MKPLFDQLVDAIQNGKLIAEATVIAGPGIGNKMLIWPSGETMGTLGEPALDTQAGVRTRALLVAQQSARFTLDRAGEPVEVFAAIYAPPPKLIIVGAVHIAIPLVTFGKALGFQTIVVDARSAFATPERFDHADRLLIQWPADALAALNLDETTCIVVLSHDDKIDTPALAVAVRSPARYIGALGSQKTQGRRVSALHELGVSDDKIARIHSPIGLTIGARRPEEIAVAIIAEIVAVINGAAS